jgi:hypothetical protein
VRQQQVQRASDTQRPQRLHTQVTSYTSHSQRSKGTPNAARVEYAVS